MKHLVFDTKKGIETLSVFLLSNLCILYIVKQNNGITKVWENHPLAIALLTEKGQAVCREYEYPCPRVNCFRGF